MTRAAARTPRQNDLARIHIGAQRLGLIQPGDDSIYRDMLWSIARVRSASDLDRGGRQRVIEHLRACGADLDRRPSRMYKRGSQSSFVRHLWTMLSAAGVVLEPGDRALRRFCAHQLEDVAVDEIAPQHLDHQQACAVIEQLKRWCSRVGFTEDMIRDGVLPSGKGENKVELKSK